MKLIEIINQGQLIIKTSYFDSEPAQRGLLYLSWNAGAARLLVPDCIVSSIEEMRTGEFVIISRGPLVEYENRDALELLFEDKSDSPYSLHIEVKQTDRIIPSQDQGSGFIVSIWTRNGEALRLPGKYREVAALPCLQEWSEH